MIEYWRHERGLRVEMVVGHSRGANVAILYAATDGDLPAVVNVAGRFDMAKFRARYTGRQPLAVYLLRGRK